MPETVSGEINRWIRECGSERDALNIALAYLNLFRDCLKDFADPENWDNREVFHRYGSIWEYVWIADTNPYSFAQNALDALQEPEDE